MLVYAGRLAGERLFPPVPESRAAREEADDESDSRSDPRVVGRREGQNPDQPRKRSDR